MGIVDRAKEIASKKKHEFDEGVEKEKRYTAYKHPDADYIVHGQRPYGPKTKAQSEEADEFASRKAGEEAKAAERRERNREKKERIKAAVREKAGNVARNIGGKLKSAMRERPHQPAPRQSGFGTGLGGGFELGLMGGANKGFDPIGIGKSKPINPLGKTKPFSLGLGIRNKKGKPKRFSLF